MAIALVQSKVVLNPGSGAGSFTGNTTAGNCVVAGVFTYSGSNVTIATSAATLGGSAGNFALAAWAQSAFASSDTQYVGAWVDPNCAGGQTAVAITASNATWTSGAGLILSEWSGVALASPVDAAFCASNSATTGTAVSSGTATGSAVANEMALGMAYPDNALSAESGSYTNLLLGSSSPYTGAMGYAAMASPGTTLAYTGTGASSGPWAALVIALKPPGAAFTRNLQANQAVMRAALW